MKILIDINEKDYEDILNLNFVSDEMNDDITKAIQNGYIISSHSLTNGKIVENIFSEYEFRKNKVNINQYDSEMIECDNYDLFFDIDWWNDTFGE